MNTVIKNINPFKPGAGHMPPYLAGRIKEKEEFSQFLGQKTILKNPILTGLRGVGKTVLLENFKPMAVKEGWFWTGADLSESACVSEETIALRLLSDLAVVTSGMVIDKRTIQGIGFLAETKEVDITLHYDLILRYFASVPGLIADKLTKTFEFVWNQLSSSQIQGIVFAYDEAQTLSDRAEREQYPLSVMLQVFQSIQRKDIPFMLILTGLPTLLPKLVEARTYSERMFKTIFLDRLSDSESKEAINIPTKDHPIQFTSESIALIISASGGYPYFIQFICKEYYDLMAQRKSMAIPIEDIMRKLDTDFFYGRWAKATDRERQLLAVAASLNNLGDEFTVSELVATSAILLKKPFGQSQIGQMLVKLIEAGLVYKDRHGKYAFAVPLLGTYINRQKIFEKKPL